MKTDSIEAQQERLRAVQRRVRELVLLHDQWLPNRFEQAFADKLKLNARHSDEEIVLYERQWQMARELLSAGYLFDPTLSHNSAVVVFDFTSICPAELAIRLKAHIAAGKSAPKLSPQDIAEALEAFDLDMQYQIGNLPDAEREEMAAATKRQLVAGSHVWMDWVFWLLKPLDWPREADAFTPEFSGLSDEDYLTVALYKLGGLADVDSQRPLISQPCASGDWFNDLLTHSAWKSRLPVAKEAQNGQESELDVVQLPPHVAEQMLAVLEARVQKRLEIRRESLPHGGAVVSTEVLDLFRRTTAAVDSSASDSSSKRTAERVIREFDSGEQGDTDNRAVPRGAEAIDESDVAILAFLGRNPTLRRKVSDVMPDSGPTDRKAISKRLRRMADQAPPLVEYPKGKHGKVAILLAGIEILKRTTAPTPQ